MSRQEESGTVDTKPTIWTPKLLGPARLFDAINWNTYTMQVYFYKTALIESGYLPEGTTFDDVEVCIVNFPGKEFEDGKLYKKYPKAFDYDKDLMDGIFTWDNSHKDPYYDGASFILQSFSSDILRTRDISVSFAELKKGVGIARFGDRDGEIWTLKERL